MGYVADRRVVRWLVGHSETGARMPPRVQPPSLVVGHLM